MDTKITCPVCGRSEIEGNRCPNCETDLSLIRMLVELPEESSTTMPKSLKYLGISLAIFLFILGLTLGGSASYLMSKNQQDLPKSSVVTSSPSSTVKKLNTYSSKSSDVSCIDGFYYTVQEGDYLLKISRQFYGNSENLSLLLETNPKLLKRENTLEIGEIIFIPNQNKNC
ncbi:MAG: LysM peptidoglycan-binding domain-containing protein [Crocosphaera sp.]